MIRYRRATRADLNAVLDLIKAGFSLQGNNFNTQEGEEYRILFSYLYSRPDWNPDWLHLAETDSKIIAAVGYFPQTLSFEDIAVPVWAISPVVTDREFRGQGVARICINNASDNLKEMGIPAVFLWGLPSFYPELDFVPILPRYKTKISLKNLSEQTIKPDGIFRECLAGDLKILSNIYNRNNPILWLQPWRNLEWWQQRFLEMDIEQALIKEVPFPKKGNFLVWENKNGEISGYLHFTLAANNDITITEAVATNINCASLMLQSFIKKYLSANQTLFIRGTPEHMFNAAAYGLGGSHLNPAPLAGMVKIIDWSLFLILLTPLLNKRFAQINSLQKKIDWCWTGDKFLIRSFNRGDSLKSVVTETAYSVSSENQLLTRFIFGLYNHYESADAGQKLAAYFPVIFPQKYPFIWDANYLY